MREREPMSYEKPGPEKGEAYGMAAVTQAFQGTAFPATKEELIRRAGDHQISWTKGGPKLRLADLVRQAPTDNFPSMANVVSAVADAARRAGTSEHGR